MLITLPQADKKDFPLYLRLINEIKSKIHSGEIAAGEKMPSLRKLAHDLEVSRTTAEAAYSQLVAEGYLIASPNCQPQTRLLCGQHSFPQAAESSAAAKTFCRSSAIRLRQ